MFINPNSSALFCTVAFSETMAIRAGTKKAPTRL